MKAKLFPIKWFRVVEGSNCADNYCEYTVCVNRPDIHWRPITEKYFRQRSRFKLRFKTKA